MLPTKWHMFKNEKCIPGLPSQVGKSINWLYNRNNCLVSPQMRCVHRRAAWLSRFLIIGNPEANGHLGTHSTSMCSGWKREARGGRVRRSIMAAAGGFLDLRLDGPLSVCPCVRISPLSVYPFCPWVRESCVSVCVRLSTKDGHSRWCLLAGSIHINPFPAHEHTYYGLWRSRCLCVGHPLSAPACPPSKGLAITGRGVQSPGKDPYSLKDSDHLKANLTFCFPRHPSALYAHIYTYMYACPAHPFMCAWLFCLLIVTWCGMCVCMCVQWV